MNMDKDHMETHYTSSEGNRASACRTFSEQDQPISCTIESNSISATAIIMYLGRDGTTDQYEVSKCISHPGTVGEELKTTYKEPSLISK